MFIVTLFSLKFNIIFLLGQYFCFYRISRIRIRIHFQSWIRIRIHIKKKLDPDPHNGNADPDPHKVNADPKHWKN
jgi:hypothetical protein